MVGIGFRKDFAEEFINENILKPDFIEVAPENWMNIGGFWKKKLEEVTSKYPLFTHGLSLSLGGPDKLDESFLKEVKKFISEQGAILYTEHLSFSKCDNAHLYDLLPIPFTRDAINHVSSKIIQAQDILKQTLAIEIVSYYTPVAAEMTELEFVTEIIKKSGCNLLLDVNNIYVNAFNHGYQAEEFIQNLPLDKVVYIHMAGHELVAEDLIIDTHGQAIIDPVFKLFEFTMEKLDKDVPVLLERDFNIPSLNELQQEISKIREIKRNGFKKIKYEIA